MPAGARARVLSVYRQILRTGRCWAGSREEQQYIYSEAQKHFRANQHTTEPADQEKQILEGELRLQYAHQYQIPYPRLEHKTQYKRSHPAPKTDFGRHSSAGRPPASGKLAEAIQRRKQAQQDKQPG
ncbi:LYR motif containing protein 1 [Trebouxia sp. C0010 RCD-2024]